MSMFLGENTGESVAALVGALCPSRRLALDLIKPYHALTPLHLIQQQATARPNS
jgi:hypothetical protein